MIPDLYCSSHNRLARIKSGLTLFIVSSMWICLQSNYAVMGSVIDMNLQR